MADRMSVSEAIEIIREAAQTPRSVTGDRLVQAVEVLVASGTQIDLAWAQEGARLVVQNAPSKANKLPSIPALERAPSDASPAEMMVQQALGPPRTPGATVEGGSAGGASFPAPSTFEGGGAGGATFPEPAMSLEAAFAVLDRAEADPSSVDRAELAAAVELLTSTPTVAPGVQSRARELLQAAGAPGLPTGVTATAGGAEADAAVPSGPGPSGSSAGEVEVGREARRAAEAAQAKSERDLLTQRRILTEIGREAGKSDDQIALAWDQVLNAEFAGEAPVEESVAGFRDMWLGDAIGVPNDFQAARQEPTTQAGGGDSLERWRQRTGRTAPTRDVDVKPRFFEGDEFDPARLPFEERAELQSALVEAGLLEDGTYWVGEWDDASLEAYKTVLGFANRWGASTDEALDRLQKSLPDELRKDGGAGTGEATFTPPAFLAPDYASLAQGVKSMFRTRVGRDPSEEELSQLAGQFGGFYRQQFDAEVAAQRSEFDARQAGAETGETVAPAAGTAVDPAARFAELFESRFKPEIDRLGSLDDVRANTNNVFASLRTMSSLVGGQ